MQAENLGYNSNFALANLVNEQVADQFKGVVKGSILDFPNPQQEQPTYAAFIGVEPARVGKHHVPGENHSDMCGNLVVIQEVVVFPQFLKKP